MTYSSEDMYSWPNILTFVRICAVPLLVVFYYLPVDWAHTAAAAIFLGAAMTDWLDGYLARYLQQTTKLGAFLDPVADKLMVSISLVLIVAAPIFHEISYKTFDITIQQPFLTIPAAIIVARELIVSALREWMAEIGKRKSVAVSSVGKLKTAVQMLSLMILLYCNKETSPGLILAGLVLLYVAAVLTIWSMLMYLNTALTQLRSS